ncbi:MAG TPA: hypothetical protein PLF13_00525 [candidate division Zixibacteria bacterium]|nr:hypothetical protein [candidate division Zixibacteria bacterium]
MKRPIRIRSVVLFLILFMSAGAARAEFYRGRVELKDGVIYADVSFRLDQVKQEMIIQPDRTQYKFPDEIIISLNDIASVLDPTGKDITAEVVSGSYRGDDKGDTQKETPDRRWKTMFCVGAEYSLLSGDYFDGLDAGFGFDIALVFSITRDFSLRLCAGRTSLSGESDAITYETDQNHSVVDQDFSGNIWRYLICGQYNSYMNASDTNDISMFYIYGGLGSATVSRSLDVVIRDNTGQTSSESVSASESRFAGCCGIGMVRKIYRNISGDVALHWSVVYADEELDDFGYGSAQLAHVVSLRAGLSFHL